MSTTTLVPNGDVTTTGWVSSGASFYTEVDEGRGSADGDTTNNHYSGVISSSSIRYRLTDTPADYPGDPDSVTVYINAKKVVSDNDNVNWDGGVDPKWSILTSGGTALADGVVAATALLTTYNEFGNVSTAIFTGKTKAQWDDAEIILRFTGSASGMADATREPWLTAVDVVLTYTPAGATSVKDLILTSGLIPWSR